MGRNDAMKGIRSPPRRRGRKSTPRKRRRTSPRFKKKRSNARRRKKKYNLDHSSSDDYSMTTSDDNEDDGVHDDNDKNVNDKEKEQEADVREKDGRGKNITFDPSVVDGVTSNPPDPSNLQDHYTDTHCVAFESRFFGKKLRGNEVCKSREERDIIFDVVHKMELVQG